MVCLNLERLLSLSIPYHHEFDRSTHALSTPQKLKEHMGFGEPAEVSELSSRDDRPGSLGPSPNVPSFTTTLVDEPETMVALWF